MGSGWNANARRLGVVSATATAGLSLAYAITLVAGLLSLTSPDQPIGDPYFPLLELLILLIAPVMVTVMIAVQAWAAPEATVYSVGGLMFMVLMAGTTSSVHFVVLTLSRHPRFADQSWAPLVLEFQWPSVVYALDILAWDVFFPLAVLCAAPVMRGSRLAAAIRVLLILSGVLALGGLSGVIAGDMGLRNIGILGYAVVFPVATAMLAALFHRTPPVRYRAPVPHTDVAPTAVGGIG